MAEFCLDCLNKLNETRDTKCLTLLIIIANDS